MKLAVEINHLFIGEQCMHMWCLTLTWVHSGVNNRSVYMYVFIVKFSLPGVSLKQKNIYIYLMPRPSLPVRRKIRTVEGLFAGILQFFLVLCTAVFSLNATWIYHLWHDILLCSLKPCVYCDRNSDFSWNISRRQCVTRVYTPVFRI